VLDRGAQRHEATERVAHDVGPGEAEVLDERRDVAGHDLRAQRAVDVGGAAVCLQVDGDDPASGAERGHDRLELGAGSQAAVQQDERLTGALLLVVQRHTVDVCVAHSFSFARSRRLTAQTTGGGRNHRCAVEANTRLLKARFADPRAGTRVQLDGVLAHADGSR